MEQTHLRGMSAAKHRVRGHRAVARRDGNRGASRSTKVFGHDCVPHVVTQSMLHWARKGNTPTKMSPMDTGRPT